MVIKFLGSISIKMLGLYFISVVPWALIGLPHGYIIFMMALCGATFEFFVENWGK